MNRFEGFPRGTKYTSVPSPLLGQILQDIDSLAEFKCTLRTLALIHQRRSRGLWVTLAELMADTLLLSGLAHESRGAAEAIRDGVTQAAQRGTLLLSQQKDDDPSQTLLFINDEPGRHALARFGPETDFLGPEDMPEGALSVSQPNIFLLYEENIGPLTPLLAEELKEAETIHPWPWIQEAFREAVSRNRRSWRYIARMLDRWAREGKDDGEPGRHSQKTDPREYLRRYGHLAR